MKKKENITTIKNIFKIDPLIYFFAIISILIGAYKEFIIISVLIIIHELGHFLCAKLLGIEVDKIIIYPLGGISKFHMDLNVNPKKEFLILIMGPIFQIVAYYLLIAVLKEKELITMYHVGILSFNLLPIYPLDGGKLVNLIFNNYLPYKYSLKLSILVSYLVTIIILFSNTKFNINMIITYIVLISLIRKEELKISLYYNKFLLERLLNNYSFKKVIKIKNPNHFYRYKKNKIKIKEELLEEREYLIKKYNFFNKSY